MNEMPTMLKTQYGSNSFGIDSDKGFQSRVAQMFEKNSAHDSFKPQQQEITVNARIIKVYIADPNENLPLPDRLLFTGEEKLTDLTDQELFFEIPINDLLAKHNEVRAKTIDKKQAEKFGRDIYLEPAKIRDLKMVVVSVANF